MEKTSKLGRDGAFWGLVMVAPTVIGLIVLNIYPFIDTIYMSFSKSLPFGEFEFEGIENYVEMFQSPEFWQATWNTILFCILTVPVGIFLALLVAVLLNSKIKGRTTFRAIFFLPMVVAPAAVAMVWKWIFNSQYGIINQLLDANIGWLTDSQIVLVTCSVVQIWSNIGYDAVLLLAGLQNISVSLYEAADLDGASKVRQFFSITLPMVSPTLFVVLIMRLMIFNQYSPGSIDTTLVSAFQLTVAESASEINLTGTSVLPSTITGGESSVTFSPSTVATGLLICIVITVSPSVAVIY